MRREFKLIKNTFLKWLYPGMGIKRWVLLVFFGIIIALIGSGKLTVEDFGLFRVLDITLIIFGVIFIIIAVYKVLESFISILLPDRGKELVNIVYEKKYLERGPRIVVIGGGTGLSTILHGLKEYTSKITAVVTVADDGGSSGRLREQFDILPPGDIRNCLVALADAEPMMQNLFQFRFDKGSEFGGHNFGNLFITVMTKLSGGDFEQAIKESSKVLAIRGQVIPSTTNKVSLLAEYQDGSIAEGEAKIPERRVPIKKVYLKPLGSPATPDALKAIKEADAIIIGPGSLYTSILPNLLIKEITEALVNSPVPKIYICNVMTQPGETDGYSASDHVRVLQEHSDSRVFNCCVVNNSRLPVELLEKYRNEDAYPVVADAKKAEQLGCRVVEADVASVENFIRHDPRKLAAAVVKLISARKHARP